MAALSLYARCLYVFTVGFHWLAKAILAKGPRLCSARHAQTLSTSDYTDRSNNETFGQN